jgi:signal peptidase I
MNWKDRKTVKYAREVLQGSRKWLRINRDLLSAAQATSVAAAIGELQQAVSARSVKEAAARAEKVEQKIGGALPASKHPGLRENVEMLLVVGILVMGIRTFFFQPFKIPTGSMQPTLYGVYPPPPQLLPYNNEGDQPPSLLARLAGIVLEGKIYERFGYRSRGDHIFVDRFTYHFRKPRRGEVIVFDTAHIPEIPSSSRGKFYIKRLIGLPDDVIRIDPPYVLVNGQILDDRPAFQRIYSLKNGYNGYVIPGALVPVHTYFHSPADTYTVPDGHLFVLGDNSVSSLDGRFWGSLPEPDLVGRAVFVYWPITRRFGFVD